MLYSTPRNQDKQTLKTGSAKISDLRPPSSQTSRTARVLVSLAAVLLLVASAGFGMLFAWRVGSQHDTILGTLSVAMALGTELSKPFAISSAFLQLRQWNVIGAACLLLVGLLAVCYSLQAELTFMSMTRSDLVAQRASISDAVNRAEQRYKEVVTQLDTLKPVSNKERDLNSYLARRAELQTELHTAEHDRQSAPVVSAPDPGAMALSVYAASLGAKVDPAVLGLWLPLIGVLALELGAAFSVVLVRSVAGAQVAHVAQAHSTGDVVAHSEAPAVSTDERAPPQPTVSQKRATLAKHRQKRRDDDDQAPRKRGLSGLLDAVQASSGKVVSLSQRKLARQIGVSRRTLERALRDAAAAGAVVIDTGKTETRLSLA
jgi:hypothetical protein